MHARFKEEPSPADNNKLDAPIQGAFFREIGKCRGYNPRLENGFQQMAFL